ncbi:MAG TPA: hypothetical protein V6D10_03980 [Trichocoleus sp.]|jgi:hypothetical protein
MLSQVSDFLQGELPGDRLSSPPPLDMASDLPSVLKYNITALESGVLLSIWEPAPKNETRVKPFLYMVRYRLSSEADAKKLLAQYVATYKVVSLLAQER